MLIKEINHQALQRPKLQLSVKDWKWTNLVFTMLNQSQPQPQQPHPLHLLTTPVRSIYPFVIWQNIFQAFYFYRSVKRRCGQKKDGKKRVKGTEWYVIGFFGLSFLYFRVLGFLLFIFLLYVCLFVSLISLFPFGPDSCFINDSKYS